MTIHGRVQGVGFRHFTRQTAGAFDIRGWVRNAGDGSVEVLATGTEANLRSFREQLEIGPRSARVERINSSQVDEQMFESFSIRA